MIWESQWALALVGIPTFLFIFICEVFLFRRHASKFVSFIIQWCNVRYIYFIPQIYYTASIFLIVCSVFMLLSCSASLRYIKNSRHKISDSNQTERAEYFMLLTISLNGAIWVSDLFVIATEGLFFGFRVILVMSHFHLWNCLSLCYYIWWNLKTFWYL